MTAMACIALAATGSALAALPGPQQPWTSWRKSLVAFSVVVLVTALVTQQ